MTFLGAEGLVPEWAQWLLGAAATITALGVIWRKAVRPFYRLANKVERVQESLPALLDIADEFTPNGGGSLPEIVRRVEEQGVVADTKVDSLTTTVKVHAAEDVAAFTEIKKAQMVALEVAAQTAKATQKSADAAAEVVRLALEERADDLAKVVTDTAAAVKVQTLGTVGAVKTPTTDETADDPDTPQ